MHVPIPPTVSMQRLSSVTYFDPKKFPQSNVDIFLASTSLRTSESLLEPKGVSIIELILV